MTGCVGQLLRDEGRARGSGGPRD
eukprot:SAG11_NODE_14618_length_605_cov_1.924901_1_plen_23_part_10